MMMTKKNIFLCILLLVLSLVIAVTVFAENKFGDINSDGNVDISDSVRLAQYLAEWNMTLNPDEEKAADVFYDGSIDAKDAVKLAQYLAGWSVTLGGTETEKDNMDAEVEISDIYTSYNGLVIYPEFPSAIRRIYDYDVSVTAGDETASLPVYNHVMELNITRRPGVDMYRRFSMFAFEGCEVRVDIKVKTDFTSYTVFPSAKKFRHTFNDGVISVYLDKPDYFGIQLDDDQNSIISIFADAPEQAVPKKGSPDVIYVEGWYEPEDGILKVSDEGTTVYLAPGSVLNGRVYVEASNCKILGRGAIVDPYENIYEYDIRVGGKEWNSYHMIDFTYETRNCLIDGPVVLDARTYNFLCHGRNHTVRNLKELSTMITSDGIELDDYCTAEHCWFYVGDNGIVSSAVDGMVARDITIGTTCGGLFPQGECDNLLFEDINIFRADEGVINNYWNSAAKEQTFSKMTFRRLSAVEMPTGLVQFLQTRNMGTLPKTMTFEDISIPSFKNTLLYNNGSGYMFTSNYTLNFRNLSVGGKVIKSPSEIKISNPESAECTENISWNGLFTGVRRNEKTVNYKAKDKVYIGSCQVFLSEVKRNEDGGAMLPADEILTLLRSDIEANAEYVTPSELVWMGAARKADQRDGNIYLEPVYDGENLLLPDEGEVSRFGEQVAYTMFLTTNRARINPILTVHAQQDGRNVDAGISRSILDEIRMYGEGTYRFSLSAKAIKEGKLKFSLMTESGRKNNPFSVTTNWQSYSFDVKITAAELSSTRCLLLICGQEKVLDEFSVRDLSFTRIG